MCPITWWSFVVTSTSNARDMFRPKRKHVLLPMVKLLRCKMKNTAEIFRTTNKLVDFVQLQ